MIFFKIRMMKRKEKEIPKGMVKYKKVGGGSFLITIEGKLHHIKPNQEFNSYPEDIPVNFRDVVIPLSELREANPKLESEPVTSPPVPLEYFVKPKGGGFYDVVDKAGKVQNDKGLREDKAKKLVESLLA